MITGRSTSEIRELHSGVEADASNVWRIRGKMAELDPNREYRKINRLRSLCLDLFALTLYDLELPTDFSPTKNPRR